MVIARLLAIQPKKIPRKPRAILLGALISQICGCCRRIRGSVALLEDLALMVGIYTMTQAQTVTHLANTS